MKIEISVEKISNGIIIGIGGKLYFFKNSYGVGKYLQEEIEKLLDAGVIENENA